MDQDTVAKPAKARPARVLPTERIAFPKQLDLLRAYGALGQGGAVALKDAAEMVRLNPTTATLANGFFVDNGLLQKGDGGRLVPGPDTIAYARAFQWNPESAARKLEPALASSWFAAALIPRLRYGAQSEEQAIAVLAEASAAGPTYKAQLRMILEYLKAAGMIELDASGTYFAGRSVTHTADKAGSPSHSLGEPPGVQRAPSVSTAFIQPTDGVVQFQVSVKVEMAEFSGWPADRIAAFFGGIAQVLAAKGAIERGAAGD
jgi:hypothetical protein